MDDKETAIANLKRYLSKDGVLYGATILGDDAAHNAIGRMLLRLYNDKGVFHNMADTLDDLLRRSWSSESSSISGTFSRLAL